MSSAANPPAAPAKTFKSGQRVQYRTAETLPTDPALFRADPPIAGGRIEFWIYAKVLRVLDEGKLYLEIAHPGNPQHAQIVIADPAAGEVRTKADVMAQHASLEEANPIYRARKLAHLKTQADLLD